MTRSALLVAVLSVALLVATAIAAERAVKFAVPRRPQLVVHVARVNPESRIESEFVARSTPESANFRQHLSKDQLVSLVRGKPESVEAVVRFMQERECADVHVLDTRDVVVCTVESGTAIAADIAASMKAGSGRTEFAVPAALQGTHVRAAMIVWPKKAGEKAAAGRAKAAAGQPGMTQTPGTILSRYGVPTTPPTYLPANFSQGVAEFEGEYFTASDMTTFSSKYNFPDFDIPVMGANVPSANADAVEGTLDLQYMGAMSLGRMKTWWLEGGVNNNNPGNIDFTTWADKVLALDSVPTVISISWGMGYERYGGSTTVMDADNDAFRKLGLMGVSVLVASGDDGPGDRSGIFQCKSFTPAWPSSSPYVTSVGATYANSENEPEEAVNWSGGGFSTVFARPAWQAAAVSRYLSSTPNLPAASFYNASGRGYPDVSAVGVNFNVFVGGSWQAVSGTSCASPTFAGIVALIAAERQSQGKPALGFLNPKLYQLGKVGFDVTAGQNQDNNCIPGMPIPGFPATAGWDAVSGLGTPSYTFLRENL